MSSNPELAAIRARKLEQLQRQAASPALNRPVEINDATFDAFVQGHPTVVVDCWAPWCGPCRAMAPIVDEMAAKWAGKVVFGKLNTDENGQTAQRHGIQSIPTLLVFRNGRLVDQVVGLPPKKQLFDLLAPLAA